MQRTVLSWPGWSLSLVIGALYACASNADLPIDYSSPDSSPNNDGKQPPKNIACRPTVSTNLSLPLFELRSTVPYLIEVVLADSGGATDPHPLKVVLAKADGTVVKTLVDAPKPLGKLSLNFTPSAEKDLPTGTLQLKAEVGCPASTPGTSVSATATLYLVRLGATKLGVGDGEGGGRVPLMYHALDQRDANYFPIPETLAASSLAIPAGEPDLDKLDGTPRSFPEKPWADLNSPPVDESGAVIETGNTLPISLKIGTKPELIFSIGKTAQYRATSQPTGLLTQGLPPIRLVVDGTPGSDTALLNEGGEVRVVLATSPVPAIDRVDQVVSWHFEFQAAGAGYVKIPGSDQSVTLRFYGVLGNEQGTMAPDLPWVAVVDDATKKIAGSASDSLGARKILVQHVYEELGLAYDRKAGASHYTEYAGAGGWSTGTFALSDFLKRTRGSIVNCSDCASILSTYANMIGAKLHYAIIGWSFKLNPILGIGATMFGSPFVNGKLEFSYHAVTTPDATMTIDDATLAVDGDSDPQTAPYTKLLVHDLTGSDYLTRLSPTHGTGSPVYEYNDQITRAN